MIAEQDIDRVLAVLKIIWLALLGSLALYLVVGRLVAPEFALAGERGDLPPYSAPRLIVLGFVTLVAAKYVRRLDPGRWRPRPRPRTQRQASLPQRYASAVIASLAMSESVGVYGLLLFLLGKDEMDLYLLVGISAVAMYYFRPRREELLNLGQSGIAKLTGRLYGTICPLKRTILITIVGNNHAL